MPNEESNKSLLEGIQAKIQAVNKDIHEILKSFSTLQIRLRVIETILTHPNLGNLRAKLIENGLTKEDLNDVVNEYIIPEIQRFKSSNIVTPDGRPVVIEENES